MTLKYTSSPTQCVLSKNNPPFIFHPCFVVLHLEQILFFFSFTYYSQYFFNWNLISCCPSNFDYRIENVTTSGEQVCNFHILSVICFIQKIINLSGFFSVALMIVLCHSVRKIETSSSSFSLCTDGAGPAALPTTTSLTTSVSSPCCQYKQQEVAVSYRQAIQY